MREKMASLGNLVAGVAHEVNNPIGAVNSAADVARRCVDRIAALLKKSSGWGELEASRPFRQSLKLLGDNVDLISAASERIVTIVRSLKNFARLDEAEFMRADLREGLESTLALVQHELKNRAEVREEYGEVPPIACYPNQLNQVFMNLLVNAAQAIDGKGTVAVRTFVDGEYACVQIADTGRGIAPEHLERIFDPGFTTKGVGVGTGLGLSISYNIVQQHDGEILVDSAPGKGTTFTIRLPIRREPG
jgi:two-component system NtrC family sensor kinase